MPETFTCPVCGFDGLESPPINYSICDCCGTEFYNDDGWQTHAELRQKWIDGGMKWWFEEPPPNWNAQEQLKNLEKKA